jgi:hypothetical protein
VQERGGGGRHLQVLVAFGQSVWLTKPQSCGVWLLVVGTQ